MVAHEDRLDYGSIIVDNENNLVHAQEVREENLEEDSDRKMASSQYLAPPHHHSDHAVTTEEEDEAEEVDPFTHRIHMSKLEWIRTAVFTFTVLPVRLLLLMLTVVNAWIVSALSISGLSPEEKASKPLTSWRRLLQGVCCRFGRIAFRLSSFQSVTVKGRQATSEEAPVLVVAPHSTFFDGFAVFWSGLPYIVSRLENKQIPFLGKCFECDQVRNWSVVNIQKKGFYKLSFFQALFVSREDPQSWQKTVREIIRRANSVDGWKQLMIFPEGSTSNRQALMTFKPGAFYPGKPVQPVIIRYPNKTDTVTWTWNQSHGAFTVLWLTLTQFYSRAEIEFLPVYHPNEQEMADPKLYARNVREVMSVALGVPTSDVTFEEAKARFGKKKRRRKLKWQ